MDRCLGHPDQDGEGPSLRELLEIAASPSARSSETSITF
jgi:hypothetical protein